ncbi:MAG TPA: hypothetical protein VH280_05885 [Verrucomicrobiae bacterium]|jgi:hypothetical protein|nr:hypothetical protein [Verrucomicrobiae bacterium]
MPSIAQIGSVVTVTPSEDIQIVHGQGRYEFINDPSPFALKISGAIEENGRVVGVYGETISGHERYKGLIVSLLLRLDGSDWKIDNHSAANFIVSKKPVKPNGKHPIGHPEGVDIEGYPFICRYGRIDSRVGTESIVNSAKGARLAQQT